MSKTSTCPPPSQAQTPMMEQYLRLKAQHPEDILFFRMGDFYEMFYEDAEIASRTLGLTLTSRDKGSNPIPMAGIPHRAADRYIRRLIDAGYRIAVAEQVEDPAQAKGLVDRDVVDVLTPGTITDASYLTEKEANFLLGVRFGRHRCGLAWIDLSTGRFFGSVVPREDVLDEVERVGPSEILYPEGREELMDEWRIHLSVPMWTPYPDAVFGQARGTEVLKDLFGVQTLEGFGFSDDDDALPAAGAVIHYLRESKKGDLSFIDRLAPFSANSHLVLDRATRRSLELTETQRDRDRVGSLLHLLDRTETAMGGRLFREWLLAPLTDAERIENRLDVVERFVEEDACREAIGGHLRNVHDLERLTVRISRSRAGARDLVSLAQSLEEIPALRRRLPDADVPLLTRLHEALDPLPDLTSDITRTLVDDPPLTLTEGGLIRDGVSDELDEYRSLARDGKTWMAEFQKSESERTGIPSLKVGHNKVFGYYIEITHTHKERVPDDYTRKQTLKNAERYITPELKKMERQILESKDKADALEYEIFKKLRKRAAEQAGRIQRVADAVARLDVFVSLAEVARTEGYVRPRMAEDDRMRIENGRHPVLERTLTDGSFVPNDVEFGPSGQGAARTFIITGPNAAGKSTYIRQIALLTIMAQMGGFIPATEAELGVVDRIFTRIGASDELSKGLSTFMVEMTETANILNNATNRSLVILDEVGRGTSTFDGVSLAWSITEHLHTEIGARTLFATHYHELTELSERFTGIRNLNVAVREWEDEIIFLHKIQPGATDRSHGIQVARLAGLPDGVLDRARTVLGQLEDAAMDMSGRPLVGNIPPAERPTHQLHLFAPPPSPLTERLEELNPNELTPLEALQTLFELKQMSNT